jgi:hypothetical protein
MSNANHPVTVIAFTELEEAFFRAGELLSEADPSASTSGLELGPRRWAPWRWLVARLRFVALL